MTVHLVHGHAFLRDDSPERSLAPVDRLAAIPPACIPSTGAPRRRSSVAEADARGYANSGRSLPRFESGRRRFPALIGNPIRARCSFQRPPRPGRGFTARPGHRPAHAGHGRDPIADRCQPALATRPGAWRETAPLTPTPSRKPCAWTVPTPEVAA